MKPNIGLSEKNLKSITSVLSSVLSDAILLIHKNKKIPLECFRQQFYGIA